MSLVTLTQRRRGNRGAVTKLLTKIKGIVDDTTLDRNNKIHELEKKLADLHSKLKIIETLDSEILAETQDADITTEIDNVDSFNDVAFDGRDAAEYELSKLKKEVSDADAAIVAAAATAAAAAAAAAAALNPPLHPAPPIVPTQPKSSNLPKFDLPEFDGSILLWRAFWDVFEFEIHSKSNYTGATKFNFLNSRLKGTAKAALSGLTPTNDNYPKAVDILVERFGQPQKIIAAHMRGLYHMAKPSGDRASLRVFIDQLESHIRSLDALGKKVDSYGDLLVCILIDKFSSDLRRNLARQHGKTEWTLEELRDALHKELEILEDSQSDQLQNKNQNQGGFKKANVLFAAATPDSKRKQVKQRCPFCTGDHYATQCTTVSKAAERLKVVKVKKLCLNCLDRSHTLLKDCPSKYRCKYCSKAHHSSLHPDNDDNSSETTSALSVGISSTITATITSNNRESSLQPYVFLKTAVVEASFKGFKASANMLIDEGSQRSFITSRLAKLLRLKPLWRENLILSGFSVNPSGVECYDVTQFFIKDLDGLLIHVKAIIIDHLVNPIDDPHRQLAASLPHLSGLPLAHPPSEETIFPIDILIGANFYWTLVKDKVIRGIGPTAIESKIGYLISGPLHTSSDVGAESSNSALALHVSALEEFDLTRFWIVEGLGVHPELERDTTTNIYQSQCIEFQANQYVAKLPWKSEHPDLASNLQVCQRRTRGTINRVAKNPALLAVYQSIISEQLERGFIERVPPGEIQKRGCHYIPHFAVEKESATTPLRIVYDCSCKTSAGVSLNDCLETGPPLQNNMLEILLRFRAHRIGLSADIEKAFHKIALHESDRDFIRFLWTNDIKNPDAELDVFRFKVIPFGASCSPFILLSVIKHHLQLFSSTIAVDMDLNIYVDNLITGCTTTDEALDYYAMSNSILNKAGLNLQSWNSNEQAINVRAVTDGVADSSTTPKVLGLTWDRVTDSLLLPKFRLASFSHTTATKRDILRGISTVYDPMGFISPITIGAKILIQEFWKAKFDWDDPLPLKFRERWSSISSDIDSVNQVVPRCYLEQQSDLHDLHLFVDASQLAYGVAAYFCHKDRVAFVTSKSRVAPLLIGKKPPTLPQLELLAALIGSILANTIVNAFKPLGVSLAVTMWSDSQIVLYWLAQKARNKCQYVANRVDTINKFSKDLKATWHYCPTKSNPADLLTRGITLRQFQQLSNLWNHGPTWLPSPKDWPSWEPSKLSTVVLHLAESQLSPVIILPVISSASVDLFKIMDVSRYDWISLIRVTAWILRYSRSILPRRHPRQVPGPLTTSELQNAEALWIKAFQRRFLQKEYQYLRSRRGARPALVSQHDLFINEDDIICCMGRLENATIKTSAKHPILLPKFSDLTTMIIFYHHKRMLHGGVDIVSCSIRQRYWIPSIKQRIRTVIRTCVTCRRVSGKPYRAPNHAPLPAFRVDNALPFTVVGVDYTGAFVIRGTASKEDQKAYVCLFTCANSRAIHLELMEDLSAQSFLLGFRRFISHHSLPSIILSDNATNFECSADFITKIFKSPEVSKYLTDHHVEWRFIPKRAPWYGGFWERLIGISKTALTKMLGRTKPTFEELRTLVAETEFVLNDRPIIKPSTDYNADEALTPSHLMYGRRLTNLPFDHEAAEEILDDPSFGEKPSVLTKAAVRLEKILRTFRKSFTTNYLTALREYHQATSGPHESVIKVGDVVLIHDEGPRCHWKLAVVENLIKSNDGFIRAADIRTSTGKTNRPISKLYPLEVSESFTSSEAAGPDVPTLPEIQNKVPSRPVRQAAAKAKLQIKNLAIDDAVDEEDE